MRKFDIGVLESSLAFYTWRSQSGTSGYGNTVTEGVAEHHEKANALRNHYLREDSDKGGVGMGYLLNLSKQLHGNQTMLAKLEIKADRAEEATARVERHFSERPKPDTEIEEAMPGPRAHFRWVGCGWQTC